MKSTARATPFRPDFGVIHGGKPDPKPHWPTFLLLLLLLGFLAFMIANALSYDDVVETGADGNPTLKPERKAEAVRRQKKNEEEAEQYILIARSAGYRVCYLCPEGKAWLDAGEIAKIGSTTDGYKRYSSAFYKMHDVYYQMEYRGELTIAKNKEINRLIGYPLLPENQKRKFKLVLPPLNSKLD